MNSVGDALRTWNVKRAANQPVRDLRHTWPPSRVSAPEAKSHGDDHGNGRRNIKHTDRCGTQDHGSTQQQHRSEIYPLVPEEQRQSGHRDGDPRSNIERLVCAAQIAKPSETPARYSGLTAILIEARTGG